MIPGQPLTITSTVGIDTGGKTWGIAFIDWMDRKIVRSMHLQVNSDAALGVIQSVLISQYNPPQITVIKRAAGVEEFEDGQSAGSRGKNAKGTRQGVYAVTALLQECGYHVEHRKAALVKPKITNKVLDKAGILQPEPDMEHANDGSRQAMFTAISDLHLPNPLR